MSYTKDFVHYYDIFKDENSYADMMNTLVPLFGEHEVTTVLDIGCGTGKIDKHLAERGYEVLGIDKNDRVIGESCWKYTYFRAS